MDKASILGDVIDFTKELQKVIKELQDELEDHSDDEGSLPKNILTSTVLRVQVEVAPLDGNEFFVKVFCEHKPGGFKKCSEMVRADHVKDSLLERTRNPSRVWPHEMTKTSDCINGVEYNPHPPHHHHQEHHLRNHRMSFHHLHK
ncbi:hypothetical protein Patl1_22258 [Pistacia atlantica]|uniref:Uncharacterized protein n=1 Tax=Pistacia atlantica TaxID=434234 RepID=A0ACC1BND9_9ROSI|nr:hypothetical protein Patl1_22258 [Pistacia atlantica]